MSTDRFRQIEQASKNQEPRRNAHKQVKIRDNMGSQQKRACGRVQPAKRTSSHDNLEGRIARQKVKVTLSDYLRLVFADSAKYSGDLAEVIQQRDALRATLPKGKHHPELYQLEKEIRRRQTNRPFKHRRALLAGLDGPGRPKSFYRLALEYDSSLTPKQYLDDDGRGRYLTKKQRAIVMKRLENIRASFLRSLRISGHRARRLFPWQQNELNDK